MHVYKGVVDFKIMIRLGLFNQIRKHGWERDGEYMVRRKERRITQSLFMILGHLVTKLVAWICLRCQVYDCQFSGETFFLLGRGCYLPAEADCFITHTSVESVALSGPQVYAWVLFPLLRIENPNPGPGLLPPHSATETSLRIVAAFASAVLIPALSPRLFLQEHFWELGCVFTLIYWTLRGVSSRSFIYHHICHNAATLPDNPAINLDINTMRISVGLTSWWWF